MTRLPLAGWAAMAALLAPHLALAQWNNEPYQFRSNIGGGAGMSTAYRQAIIDKELYGRRPENLVKGPDGRLLEVIERDQQAFLADPEPNFIVRRSGWASGGASVGVGGVAIGGWTAMVDGGPVTGYAGSQPSASPIDSWVGMLD
ncbi:MAG TPA: hypothetical protein VLL76_07215 [Candidatus Omnitrophota bacterium]|nr:hypothetical protein [Candidatus Omnitrophota bacterium]